MRAALRDTQIFFDVEGASLVPEGSRMRERPTAFLVHGGPGVDHSSLKARYGLLRERMQLVYFDHRGQGRSARCDPRKYTLDENVEDMEALRRYLGLGPIVSIGTSYGGMVAMAHAARYPDSVSHLILVATTAHAGYIARAKEIVAARGTAEQIAQCDDLFAGRLDTSEKLKNYYQVMGSLYARKDDPALSTAGLARAVLTPEPLNCAHGPNGFLRTFDLRPELAAIRAATLILAGRHDWICAPEFSEEIHRLIPHSDLRIFEESAHSIGGDEPDNFLSAVTGFLVYNTQGNRQKDTRCLSPASQRCRSRRHRHGSQARHGRVTRRKHSLRLRFARADRCRQVPRDHRRLRTRRSRLPKNPSLSRRSLNIPSPPPATFSAMRANESRRAQLQSLL